MKQRTFPAEKAFIVLNLLQIVLDLPLQILLPAIYLTLIYSHARQKCRPYSPLLVLTIILITIRAYSGNRYIKIAQILFLVLTSLAINYFRVFQVNTRFGLYEKKVQEQTYHVGFTKTVLQKPISTPVAIFYPTNQKPKTFIKWLQLDWFPVLRQTPFPNRPKLIPVWLARYLFSYLELFEIPCQQKAPFASDIKEHKIVFFSHGLSAHYTAYSAYAMWWASRGYTVVSVAHSHDQIFPSIPSTIQTAESLHEYMYDIRNRDLKQRKQQLTEVYRSVVEGSLLKQHLKIENINITGIRFAGHSFGGATILETGASILNTPYYNKVLGYICLDPWLFPLSEKSYTDLKRPVIMINGDIFKGLIPVIEDRHAANIKFQAANPQMMRLMIKGMEHLHQGDHMYVMGTGLVLVKRLRTFKKCSFYADLNIYMMYLFEQGKSVQELEKELNAQVQEVLKNPKASEVVIDTRKNKQEQTPS